MKDGEIAQDLSREEVIHLDGKFWDENGLRTLELEEYMISEKKDSYQLNDESISGKGRRELDCDTDGWSRYESRT